MLASIPGPATEGEVPMQNERTSFFPPLAVRNGVLVVDGYGIRLKVRRGRLLISDGIGRDRREATFARATSGIRRVVVLGGAGYMSLEAIRWLTDVGSAFVHIDRDGRLVLASALPGNDDPRLRRAQALAAGTPTGTSIARDLLRAKLSGQARVLDRLNASAESKAAIGSAIALLDDAHSPQELMVPESAAAVAYWEAWSGVEVPFVRADLPKVPDHWRSFGKRASPLTGNPRLAANPANAILNYLYAILEAECRIACLAVGLDPGLGVLHADQRNRDSMALDLMEAPRPEVDAMVLDLLQGHMFRARDFYETRQGVCRVLAPLTHHLAEMGRPLRRAVAPLAEQVARVLEDSGRHYCDDCLPGQKTEALSAAAARATTRLADLRAIGQDPAHGGDAKRKRSESHRARMQEAAEFERQNGPLPDRELFVRYILPGLQTVPVRRMAEITGLTSAYCGMVRRGLYVPHPRHWDALRDIACP